MGMKKREAITVQRDPKEPPALNVETEYVEADVDLEAFADSYVAAILDGEDRPTSNQEAA